MDKGRVYLQVRKRREEGKTKCGRGREIENMNELNNLTHVVCSDGKFKISKMDWQAGELGK